MTVKNILKMAIIFLGLDELLATNIFSENGTEPTEYEQKTLDELIRCLNLVLEEIATEYVPIKDEKEVVFINKLCDISSIDEKFFEAISVSVNGKNIDFLERDNFLIANASKAVVRYKKYPEELDISSSFSLFNKRLSPRIVAYGVSMEYSFIKTLSDEGAIWEKRYRDGLNSISTEKKGKRLPRLRW